MALARLYEESILRFWRVIEQYNVNIRKPMVVMSIMLKRNENKNIMRR